MDTHSSEVPMDDLDELIACNRIHRLADWYAVDRKDVDSSVSVLPDRCSFPQITVASFAISASTRLAEEVPRPTGLN
jgi:hypothetical protein